MNGAASRGDNSKPVLPKKSRETSSAKACLGLLYFSQRRFDREKTPVCAGLSKQVTTTHLGNRPPTSSEAMPGGGDFRYVCVGYSAYCPKDLKEASRSRSRHDDPVEVPYCEGLEVISAAAMSNNRELLSHGPTESSELVTGARSSPERDDSLMKHKMDRRQTLPGPFRNQDWDGFQERFDRMSRRILEKMHANATYMAKSFVRSWQQIFDDRSK